MFLILYSIHCKFYENQYLVWNRQTHSSSFVAELQIRLRNYSELLLTEFPKADPYFISDECNLSICSTSAAISTYFCCLEHEFVCKLWRCTEVYEEMSGNRINITFLWLITLEALVIGFSNGGELGSGDTYLYKNLQLILS